MRSGLGRRCRSVDVNVVTAGGQVPDRHDTPGDGLAGTPCLWRPQDPWVARGVAGDVRVAPGQPAPPHPTELGLLPRTVLDAHQRRIHTVLTVPQCRAATGLVRVGAAGWPDHPAVHPLLLVREADTHEREGSAGAVVHHVRSGQDEAVADDRPRADFVLAVRTRAADLDHPTGRNTSHKKPSPSTPVPRLLLIAHRPGVFGRSCSRQGRVDLCVADQP